MLIIEKIKKGQIVKNNKLLPERELAQELDVSRNLLREALVMLECMNLIEVHGREGIFVKNDEIPDFQSNLDSIILWPENMLRDLMEMRAIVEIPAAGIASERRDEDDLARMKQCIIELEKIHDAGEKVYGEGARWDSLLHTVIVQSTKNPLLIRVSEDLSQVLGKYIGQSRALVFSGGNWPEIILEQHRELYKAIRNKDRKQAEDTAAKHIALAREKFAG